jgi:CRISPR-associated protein Cas2
MKNKQPVDENEFVPGSTFWMLGHQEDDLFDDETEMMEKVGNRTYLVVVVYDIVDNKKRTSIAKTLLGYGVRVQKSAFECHLTQKKYEQMIFHVLEDFDKEVDLLRVYKLTGNVEVKTYGKVPETFDEDLIII